MNVSAPSAANQLETIPLEGDYVLPEILARHGDAASPNAARVKGVWLYEPDEMQIVRNYASREPDEGEQAGRARVSWLYGQWLIQECERYSPFGQYRAVPLPNAANPFVY
jgi:hypothetical protein